MAGEIGGSREIGLAVVVGVSVGIVVAVGVAELIIVGVADGVD